MLRVQFFTPTEFNDFINSIIPGTDTDIDKQYRIPNEMDNSPEAIAYRRIRSITNSEVENVNFAIAIQYLTDDVKLISKLIKDDNLKHPEELKEFVENAIAIMDAWDEQYREAFNTIKEFRDSYKESKSIYEMDADELRKYILEHNIK